VKDEDLQSEGVVSEVFDALMVASGHHHKPRIPHFPGIERFKGHVIHSHNYKDPTTGYDFSEKRVLVIGIGNSAVDIANELSRCSRQVYLATRSGAWVLPKLFYGRPYDHLVYWKRIFSILLPEKYVWCKLTLHHYESMVSGIQGSMNSWGIKPDFRINQAHPTISQELLHRVGNGTIRIKKGVIKMIDENSVLFEDGFTIKNLDAIIFCTGYHISLPILNNNGINIGEKNEIQLYKNVFSPHLPPTLSIIGLIQPWGAIMPMSEMQARWICQVLLGNKGLPSIEDMEKNIKQKAEELKNRYIDRPRHTIQVDGWVYMDEIANLIGAIPSILKNLGLWRELLFMPLYPPQFRLNGIGAKPQIAKQMLKQNYHEIQERPEKEASSLWENEQL